MSRRIYGGDCLADSSDQETQKNPRHFLLCPRHKKPCFRLYLLQRKRRSPVWNVTVNVLYQVSTLVVRFWNRSHTEQQVFQLFINTRKYVFDCFQFSIFRKQTSITFWHIGVSPSAAVVCRTIISKIIVYILVDDSYKSLHLIFVTGLDSSLIFRYTHFWLLLSWSRLFTCCWRWYILKHKNSTSRTDFICVLYSISPPLRFNVAYAFKKVILLIGAFSRTMAYFDPVFCSPHLTVEVKFCWPDFKTVPHESLWITSGSITLHAKDLTKSNTLRICTVCHCCLESIPNRRFLFIDKFLWDVLVIILGFLRNFRYIAMLLIIYIGYVNLLIFHLL